MKICGVGDNVVDRYYNQGCAFPGGNAVNFSVHAKRAGHSSAYLGVIGNDAGGDLIKSSLLAEGVDISRLRIANGPNAFATVHMDEDGNNRTWGKCDKGVSMFRLNDEDFEYLADFDLVHTGETSGIDDQLPYLSDRVAVSYDFSVTDLDHVVRVLPYIKVAAFSRSETSEAEISELIDLSLAAGVELISITQGAKGATVCHRGERMFVPASPVVVVDTLGAGDAFVSRLACEIFNGAQLEAAASKAAQYSAKICSIRGGFGHGRTMTGSLAR